MLSGRLMRLVTLTAVSVVALFALSALNSPYAHAATFVVSNTNDSGAGSLRQAIIDANNNAGADIITIQIGSGHVQIIPTSPLPAITSPVTIDGTTQGGYSGNPLVELSGNGAGSSAVGLWITGSGSGSTIKGLIINNFGANGIFMDTGGNTIINNWIGLAADGVTTAGNGTDGIGIYNAGNNTIGGNTGASRNVISGNKGNGIGITAQGGSAKNNTVIGNYIGTNYLGNGLDANGGDGVLVNDAGSSDASGNVIGGTTGTTPGGGCNGDCNVISGNGANGVGIWHSGANGTLVEGNFIGLNAGGDSTLANGNIGLEIQESPNNTIGSSSANGRNVISGNLGAGIFLSGNAATGNAIIGNYIGSSPDGNRPMGNAKMGIGIGYAPGTLTAHDNRIGGSTGTTPGGGCTGECNVIGGNGQNGILITGTGSNVIEGNHIGLNAGGDGALGNAIDGIGIADSPNNEIGGSTAAANIISCNGDNGVIITGSASTGNRIEDNYIGLTASGGQAGNVGAGVMLAGGVSTAILGNGIDYNGKLGIDLNYDNVSLNDPGDTDGGANNTQNFPNLYAARTKGGKTYISGQLNSNPSSSFRLEFFSSPGCNAGRPMNYGEGHTYIGYSDVTTDQFGNTAFGFVPTNPVAGANYIAATATRKIGGTPAETSEFSQCILVNIAKPALTDGATWYLKYDETTGAADMTYGYGFPSQFMMCAWDANQPGVKLPVIFSDGTWYMRASYTTGQADRTVHFGSSGDQPICGDWTGNGVDRIGVVNPNMTWHLLSDNLDGAAEIAGSPFQYGALGTKAVVGDWDGNGTSTVGTVDSNNNWNLRNSNSSGAADYSFHYGVGRPVVGDWDGNGYDTVGVVSSGGHWALTNYLSDGPSQIDFDFGFNGTTPLIW